MKLSVGTKDIVTECSNLKIVVKISGKNKSFQTLDKV